MLLLHLSRLFFWELTKIRVPKTSRDTPLAIPRTWRMPLCMLPITGGNKHNKYIVGYKLLSTHTIPTPNNRQHYLLQTITLMYAQYAEHVQKQHGQTKKGRQCWRHWLIWVNKSLYILFLPQSWKWKMGVSPILVSFHSGYFSTKPWLWEKGYSPWFLGDVNANGCFSHLRLLANLEYRWTYRHVRL